MLRKYNINDGQLTETEDNEAVVFAFQNPTPEEKKLFADTFSVDEHTMNSSLDPEEASRLEIDSEFTAIIFKRPKNYSAKDEFLFKVASMGIFLSKGRLGVMMAEDIPLFTGKFFKRVDSLNDVFLKLVYNSIYHYLEHLKIINMISEEIEDKISASMENKYLLNLFSLEKSLVYYVNAINSNGIVIDKLRHNAAKLGFTETNLEMVEDILVENGQCSRQAEIYANVLTGLMDARVSIVSNNLNLLMKTLNIITIGIMVPTLVVSIFSMNVPLPLQHHPLAFWLVMLLSLVSVAVVIAIFKYKKI